MGSADGDLRWTVGPPKAIEADAAGWRRSAKIVIYTYHRSFVGCAPQDDMFTFIKLLRSLIKTLHSDGSPAQIALGVALGAALGLTPIANAHNVAVLVLLAVLNVSFAAGLLAWGVFVPFGFMLDPIFDRIGNWLLVDVAFLRPLWTSLDNIPGLALTNFNNTIVLGSVVFWLLLFVPLYFAARVGVVKYRATIGERVRNSRYYKLLETSQLYSVYRWFNP